MSQSIATNFARIARRRQVERITRIKIQRKTIQFKSKSSNMIVSNTISHDMFSQQHLLPVPWASAGAGGFASRP